MSKAQELNGADFETVIASGVTLVEFWATWCGPCKMMASTLDEVASSMEGKAKIVKMNVEEETAMPLVERLGIKSIPAIRIFKDGKEMRSLVGMQRKYALIKEIESIIS